MRGTIEGKGQIEDEWLDALGRCMRLLGVEQYDECEVGYIYERWSQGASATNVAADLWGPLGRPINGQ